MSRRKSFNPSDPEHVTRREKAAERIRQRELEDLRTVMGTPQGRRMVWRLLEGSGMFRLTEFRDPYQLCFLEGQRNVGLALFNDVHTACPEAYQVMAAEARRLHQVEEAEEAGPDPTPDKEDLDG